MRTRISVALVLLSAVACGSSLVPRSASAPAPAVSEPVAPPAPAPAPPSAPAPAPPPAPAPALAPTRFTIAKGTRVLMFGDSMVTSGLAVYLKERVVARGGTFFSISKGSSTTATWTEGRELQDLLTRLHPDVVLVVLASNELFVPNPQARRYAVRAIVDRLGSRPCLWIGPAPWLPEKGIIGVVRESAAPCRFYDSTPLALERQADHIHPTLRGGKAWADAVWQDAFED